MVDPVLRSLITFTERLYADDEKDLTFQLADGTEHRQKIELKGLKTSHQEKVEELTKANKKETHSLKKQHKKIIKEICHNITVYLIRHFTIAW
jgi:hypothetical protein